ncbi:hypothetical protein [Altericroceibacterium endophyticum]|uniref:Lipoprotein n=1 Tax=Altericroceibacterium endophyticum TaxID=1808508 RepID=A0A6I4T813_9SPHN|nr:hypothetical protein [Altericroceibacterium endophyticum]MXO66143.1 hypothetical protein [Altericroceibacterium endophyticum]
MKQNHFTARFSALSTLVLSAAVLSACVPSAPEPVAPPPAPAPTPAPPPLPEPTPTYENWMDAPQTPGDWSYRSNAAGSTALFGPVSGSPLAVFSCNRSNQTLTLSRTGQATGPVPVNVLTETQERLVEAVPTGGTPPYLAMRLNARDPFLEAIAFSKGRFALEAPGEPTLYLPAWPEITRVIEDCR